MKDDIAKSAQNGTPSAEESLIGNFEINVQKLKVIDKETANSPDGNQPAIDHWHKGGRVLDAVIVSKPLQPSLPCLLPFSYLLPNLQRPYAAKVAGTPISAAFNLQKLEYTFVFEHDGVAKETEIYIPAYHYGGKKVDIRVSDGDWRYVKDQQTLYYRHLVAHKVHRIQIRALESDTDKDASKRNNPNCAIM